MNGNYATYINRTSRTNTRSERIESLNKRPVGRRKALEWKKDEEIWVYGIRDVMHDCVRAGTWIDEERNVNHSVVLPYVLHSEACQQGVRCRGEGVRRGK